MNAAEQATSLDTATKIATIVNHFKQFFPDATADLKPWRNDPNTQDWLDPDSIDIGFHFPGWSPKFQSRSMLVQIRLHRDDETPEPRAIGAEVVGFNHNGKQWQLSTIHSWSFEGVKLPKNEVQTQLKQFCRKLLEVFNA
ncbi:MAG: hypothetical protein HC860_07665 [Alkalinema sp. RU_4_3]|nr:hypothetical protein [Alkalinema sp. RU_4_3]